MFIQVGVVLLICNNTLEECSYKNLTLPTVNIFEIPENIVSSTPSLTENIVSSTASLTENIVSSTASLTENIVSSTLVSQLSTTRSSSFTKKTVSSITSSVGSTRKTVSSTTSAVKPTKIPDESSNTNSNNIPLIITGTAIGSLFGVAGILTLINRRRQRPPQTRPIFNTEPLVMPRVQRAYQST
jgi:hypothetical protein